MPMLQSQDSIFLPNLEDVEETREEPSPERPSSCRCGEMLEVVQDLQSRLSLALEQQAKLEGIMQAQPAPRASEEFSRDDASPCKRKKRQPRRRAAKSGVAAGDLDI